jgi:3-hydroxy-9,10-secoandrosta-1,3,5(10)-triene-9,17-dione monooxygenase reductase component
VNILAEDQEALARAFAVKGGHKFGGVAWLPAGLSGSPILTAALAWIDCTIEAEHDAGDHVIVVGRVNEMAVACEGQPLVFLPRRLRSFRAVSWCTTPSQRRPRLSS